MGWFTRNDETNEEETGEYGMMSAKLKQNLAELECEEVIIARGKRECACCGNKNFKWLQIDHIIPQRNSKNKEDLKTLLREIVQVKRPDSEFQLLCANCNFAKSDLKACPIDHSRD